MFARHRSWHKVHSRLQSLAAMFTTRPRGRQIRRCMFLSGLSFKANMNERSVFFRALSNYLSPREMGVSQNYIKLLSGDSRTEHSDLEFVLAVMVHATCLKTVLTARSSCILGKSDSVLNFPKNLTKTNALKSWSPKVQSSTPEAPQALKTKTHRLVGIPDFDQLPQPSLQL